MFPSLPWLMYFPTSLRRTEILNWTVGIFRLPVQTWDCIHFLTHRDPLITVRSSQPVSTAATVVAGEIPITLASAVEESQRPPLSVITSSIRVLGTVAPVVCSDGHALPSPRAGTTLIPRHPWKRRAALAAQQPLGAHALPGELRQRLGGTQGHQQETQSPHAAIHREGRWKKGTGISDTQSRERVETLYVLRIVLHPSFFLNHLSCSGM